MLLLSIIQSLAQVNTRVLYPPFDVVIKSLFLTVIFIDPSRIANEPVP
jgi:hypothetical protein